MSLADYLPSWMVKKDPAVAPYGVGSVPTTTVDNPYNVFGIRQESQPYGPWTNVPQENTFEFSDPSTYTIPITKAAQSISRLVTKDSLTAGQQSATTRPWYDIIGKMSDATKGAGDAIQSTLVKVIVLVVLVAIIAIFGLSYVQRKGENLADK